MSKLKTTTQSSKIHEIILGVLIVAYIALFSFLSINRYRSLNSHYYDLGIMNQVVYNTAQGHFLEMTNQDFKKNVSRLAVHFDPILAAFAPFYKLYQGPEVLLVAQTIILALGSIAVYLIALKVLKKKIYALMFATSYLLYFPVSRANLFDFHAVTIATTLLLWAIYFELTKKYKFSLLFILIALLTKENAGLVVFFYGLYLFFVKKNKRFGALIGALGIVFFTIATFYIIPYFRSQDHFALRYYGDFGDTPKSVLGYILHLENLRYLTQLLFAHAVLIVFSPLEFLITLPELMINILSNNQNMKSIYFHYNSLLIPFIFYSSIVGLKNLYVLISKDRLRKLIITVFLALNLLSLYLYSPLPVVGLKRAFWPSYISDRKQKIIKQWQRNLKSENIKVSTTPRLAPFFTDRRYYYNFFFDPAFPVHGFFDKDILERIDNYVPVDYIIIDRSEFDNEGWHDLLTKFYVHLKVNKSFKLIFLGEGIEVYKKVKT